MPNTKSMINGREYDFADIDFFMLGKLVIGITDIKYDFERDGEVDYGAGSEPQSYRKGKKKYTASATLQMKELVALQKSLPAGSDFGDIPPFDITVSYANEGAPITTDVIHVLMIHNNGRDPKSGGGVISKELKFLVGGIDWDV